MTSSVGSAENQVPDPDRDPATPAGSADDTPRPTPKYQDNPSEQAAPRRPLHPMPTSFPELTLPTEPDLPRPPLPPPAMAMAMPPVPLPNPHDIHDGHGYYSSEHVVCVRCGSSNLAAGQVVEYGSKFHEVFFAPKRASVRWLNSVLALFPFRSVTKLAALACRDCGFVQFVVEPGELRRAERRRD